MHRYSVAVDDLEAKDIKLFKTKPYMLSLPRRVFWNDGDIPFCDYELTDEDLSVCYVPILDWLLFGCTGGLTARSHFSERSPRLADSTRYLERMG